MTETTAAVAWNIVSRARIADCQLAPAAAGRHLVPLHSEFDRLIDQHTVGAVRCCRAKFQRVKTSVQRCR
jgi:hypothetical protein